LSLLLTFLGTCNVDCSAHPQPKVGAPKRQLQWQSSLNNCKISARQKHKLIIVDVYTDNCHWCSRLEHETFQNPGLVTELGDRFIWLKLHSRINAAELTPYKISGYPTVLVIDAQGKVVTSISGFLPPEQFVEKMEMLLP
jgi:thioredoxin-related protein